jgi:hypothetical protein
LFEILKNRLQGQHFGSADELLSEVRKIVDEISVGTLETVFREWINRVARCIAANGKYMERTKQWFIELYLTALRFGDAHLIVGRTIS